MDFQRHPLYSWLSELRRDLHRHPEPPCEETRTTGVIKGLLEEWGLEIRTPPELRTGVVALLPGGEPGPVLGLRADIDALHLEELNQVPYRSANAGVMHACGHDAHTTIMLGVARNLVESGLAGRLKGSVKFLFQPAEEKVAGARAMIAAGALEDPPLDRVLACHMWPQLRVGQAGFYRGVSHAAADRFAIHIQGRGAHGASPHLACDPVLAGAHLVTALQSVISRDLDPTDSGVVSVGIFQAGSAANVIPDSARIEGTVRSFKDEVRELIKRRIGELAHGLEAGFGVNCDYRFKDGVPPCRNDETVSRDLYRASARVLEEKDLFWLEPKTGAEDFALFTQRVSGAIMRLGCSNPERGITHPLHSPHFDIDEAVLPIGVEVFTQAVLDYLS